MEGGLSLPTPNPDVSDLCVMRAFCINTEISNLTCLRFPRFLVLGGGGLRSRRGWGVWGSVAGGGRAGPAGGAVPRALLLPQACARAPREAQGRGQACVAHAQTAGGRCFPAELRTAGQGGRPGPAVPGRR